MLLLGVMGQHDHGTSSAQHLSKNRLGWGRPTSPGSATNNCLLTQSPVQAEVMWWPRVSSPNPQPGRPTPAACGICDQLQIAGLRAPSGSARGLLPCAGASLANLRRHTLGLMCVNVGPCGHCMAQQSGVSPGGKEDTGMAGNQEIWLESRLSCKRSWGDHRKRSRAATSLE